MLCLFVPIFENARWSFLTLSRKSTDSFSWILHLFEPVLHQHGYERIFHEFEQIVSVCADCFFGPLIRDVSGRANHTEADIVSKYSCGPMMLFLFRHQLKYKIHFDRLSGYDKRFNSKLQADEFLHIERSMRNDLFLLRKNVDKNRRTMTERLLERIESPIHNEKSLICNQNTVETRFSGSMLEKVLYLLYTNTKEYTHVEMWTIIDVIGSQFAATDVGEHFGNFPVCDLSELCIDEKGWRSDESKTNYLHLKKKHILKSGRCRICQTLSASEIPVWLCMQCKHPVCQSHSPFMRCCIICIKKQNQHKIYKKNSAKKILCTLHLNDFILPCLWFQDEDTKAIKEWKGNSTKSMSLSEVSALSDYFKRYGLHDELTSFKVRLSFFKKVTLHDGAVVFVQQAYIRENRPGILRIKGLDQLQIKRRQFTGWVMLQQFMAYYMDDPIMSAKLRLNIGRNGYFEDYHGKKTIISSMISIKSDHAEKIDENRWIVGTKKSFEYAVKHSNWNPMVDNGPWKRRMMIALIQRAEAVGEILVELGWHSQPLKFLTFDIMSNWANKYIAHIDYGHDEIIDEGVGLMDGYTQFIGLLQVFCQNKKLNIFSHGWKHNKNGEIALDQGDCLVLVNEACSRYKHAFYGDSKSGNSYHCCQFRHVRISSLLNLDYNEFTLNHFKILINYIAFINDPQTLQPYYCSDYEIKQWMIQQFGEKVVKNSLFNQALLEKAAYLRPLTNIDEANLRMIPLKLRDINSIQSSMDIGTSDSISDRCAYRELFEIVLKLSDGLQIVTKEWYNKNIAIKGEDLKRLLRKEPVSDSIINYYFMLLQKRVSKNKILLLPSHFYRKLAGRDGDEYRPKKVRKLMKNALDSMGVSSIFKLCKMLFPIYMRKECHWRIGAINFRELEIEYYDPEHLECGEFFGNMRNYITKSGSKKSWQKFVINQRDYPKQVGSVDCGMYIMKAVICWANDQEFEFEAEDMNDFRRQIVIDILNSIV